MHTKGFTLSEVLITLGVIGVVAAITLPTLIQNYQKTVWVNQLKESYSILSQGFQKMLADDEVYRLTETQFGIIKDDYDIYNNSSNSVHLIQDEILKKYFNIINICNRSNDNCKSLGDDIDYLRLDKSGNAGSWGSDELIFYLKNGTKISFFFGETNGEIAIDVNGDKKPNQWGRDTFLFDIDDTGKITPTDYSDCNVNNSIGYGCAKRIIENGWKMDY